MFRHLFFDLDGTLADTEEGIILSLRYALEKMGHPDVDDKVLHSFIGPPLKDAFMGHFGMSEQEALTTLAHYREYYSGGGLYRCRLFPGVEALLQRLSGEGYGLFVATSKPEVYAKKILDHLGVAGLFREIAGSLLDKYPETKGDALMIGDKAQDLVGAAKCGIPAVGVLYGYGSREELSGEKSAALVPSPEELYRFIAK